MQKSKKRIAKNTFALYCRMFIMMAAGLYTSRIVLQALGVVDYGVYNVVGGVVMMMAFFNSSILSSTQRYLNVAMSTNSEYDLRTVFSTSVNVHAIMGLAVVVILETVGLWFVKTQLQIPEDQMNAALWVYQCSIFSFFIGIISAPYNAALVAYEDMNAFAVISLLEAAIKIGIAFSLNILPSNKLKTYAILLLGCTILMRFIYSMYCARKLPDIRYYWTWVSKLAKNMISFSGWMIFGTLSEMLCGQGVNMLINIFFGPIYNAARAIAVQVQGAVGQFSTNFIISVNPQIVKSYADGDKRYANLLVFGSSKLSFFLLMLLVIPIILRIDQILNLWLTEVPPLTDLFVDIILLEFMVRAFFSPLAQITQAAGNIKIYQLVIALVYLTSFGVSYILFMLGYPVYSTFVVALIMSLVGLAARLTILKVQFNFASGRFVRDVVGRSLLIFGLTFGLGWYINGHLSQSFWGLLTICATTVVISSAFVSLIGFNKIERDFLMTKLQILRQKYNH